MAVKKEKDIKDGKLHELFPKRIVSTADVVWFDGKTTESAEKVAESLGNKDITVTWDFQDTLMIKDSYYGNLEAEISGETFIVIKTDEDDGEVTIDLFDTKDQLLTHYRLEN